MSKMAAFLKINCCLSPQLSQVVEGMLSQHPCSVLKVSLVVRENVVLGGHWTIANFHVYEGAWSMVEANVRAHDINSVYSTVQCHLLI